MEFTNEELMELMSSVLHEAARVRAEMILAEQWRRRILETRYAILVDLAEKTGDELRNRKPDPPKTEPVQQEIVY